MIEKTVLWREKTKLRSGQNFVRTKTNNSSIIDTFTMMCIVADNQKLVHLSDFGLFVIVIMSNRGMSLVWDSVGAFMLCMFCKSYLASTSLFTGKCGLPMFSVQRTFVPVTFRTKTLSLFDLNISFYTWCWCVISEHSFFEKQVFVGLHLEDDIEFSHLFSYFLYVVRSVQVPLVRGTDPDPDLDPSIIKQK